MISTHTPLAGRDITIVMGLWSVFVFQLTRPSRGVTSEEIKLQAKLLISTHTPLAGRDEKFPGIAAVIQISTHTPLAGRDPRRGP